MALISYSQPDTTEINYRGCFINHYRLTEGIIYVGSAPHEAYHLTVFEIYEDYIVALVNLQYTMR